VKLLFQLILATNDVIQRRLPDHPRSGRPLLTASARAGGRVDNEGVERSDDVRGRECSILSSVCRVCVMLLMLLVMMM